MFTNKLNTNKKLPKKLIKISFNEFLKEIKYRTSFKSSQMLMFFHNSCEFPHNFTHNAITFYIKTKQNEKFLRIC